MKIRNLLISSILLITGAAPAAEINFAPGLKIGTLAMGGNACTAYENVALISNSSLTIPLRARIAKNSQDTLERGSCNFTLPISVPAGKRLVITSYGVRHRLDLYRTTKAITQSEIFFVGSRGAMIRDTAEARFYHRRLDRVLSTQNEVVGACGASTNLRGNISVALSGDQAAYAQISSLKLNYQLEDCR